MVGLRKGRGMVGRVGAVAMNCQKAVVDLTVAAVGLECEPSVGFVADPLPSSKRPLVS